MKIFKKSREKVEKACQSKESERNCISNALESEGFVVSAAHTKLIQRSIELQIIPRGGTANNSRRTGTSTSVFSFHWDLSGGLRKYIPKLMRPFEHVGILAYGTFYEFTNGGLRAKKVPPNQVPTPSCCTGDLISWKKLGETFKSQQEFEAWQDNQCVQDLQYNFLRNNCVSFAIRACAFLEVDSSSEWFDASKVLRPISYLRINTDANKDPVLCDSSICSNQYSKHDVIFDNRNVWRHLLSCVG